MRTVLIVEDESLVADHLQQMLEKENYCVRGPVTSAEEALDALKENDDIDMVLLDIRIEGSMDGIELAHLLESKFGLPYIYITAHSEDNTMERLLYTHPSGYVLKPFREEQVLAQMKIAFSSVTQQNRPYERLNDYVFVKHNHGFIRLKHSDILYAEANDNYTFLHTRERKYLLPLTLKKLTQRLEQFGFVRIHRSFTVNPLNIESFRLGEVHVAGQVLPVSENHRQALESRLPML